MQQQQQQQQPQNPTIIKQIGQPISTSSVVINNQQNQMQNLGAKSIINLSNQPNPQQINQQQQQIQGQPQMNRIVNPQQQIHSNPQMNHQLIQQQQQQIRPQFQQK